MMNRSSTRPWVLLAALLSVHPGLRSAPVAVPDSGYTVEEDGVLTAAGVTFRQAERSGAVSPAELSRLGTGMTVLVSCWE